MYEKQNIFYSFSFGSHISALPPLLCFGGGGQRTSLLGLTKCAFLLTMGKLVGSVVTAFLACLKIDNFLQVIFSPLSSNLMAGG
jgi:hypothetical protein